MFRGTRKEANKFLHNCQDALESARASGNQEQISIALANLGLALFEVRRFEDGLAKFDESIETARSVGSRHLQAQCLGIKALAFQMIVRYPDAYNVAEEVRTLGEENGDDGLIFDALASQGQILLESGEPIIALERFQAAHQIANTLQDTRRSMHIQGAMGNYSLHVGTPDQALGQFREALRLARELGDKQAEIGFLGNIGSILAWEGRYQEAIEPFEQVRNYVREQQDEKTEIHALKQLSIAHSKLQNDIEVLEFARAGFELAEASEDEIVFTFLETIILAYYRMNNLEEAHRTTSEAIELAQSRGDLKKEFEMRLSLAESYIVSGEQEAALETYTKAHECAKKLNHKKDEARLTGRIGFTLAEMGRLDEAIPYHQKAIEFARDRNIPDLEGEQLSMLALALLEQGEVDKARTYCSEAIETFAGEGLGEQESNARELLVEIEAAGGEV